MKGFAAIIALGLMISLVGCTQEAAPAATTEGAAPVTAETAKPGDSVQAGSMEAKPLMDGAEADARVGSQTNK